MTGWGENNRAWGDDEFWMDVVLGSLTGLFTLAGIAGAFALYRYQRRKEEADSKITRRDSALVELSGYLAEVSTLLMMPIKSGRQLDQILIRLGVLGQVMTAQSTYIIGTQGQSILYDVFKLARDFVANELEVARRSRWAKLDDRGRDADTRTRDLVTDFVGIQRRINDLIGAQPLPIHNGDSAAPRPK